METLSAGGDGRDDLQLTEGSRGHLWDYASRIASLLAVSTSNG